MNHNSYMYLYKYIVFGPIMAILLTGCNHQKYTIPVQKPYHIPSQKADQKIEAPSSTKKNPNVLSLEELEEAKNYAQATDNKELAAMYLELMIKKATGKEVLRQLRLELADLFFEIGQLKQASRLYTMYLSLYPGDANRAYVHYQAILCHYYMTFTTDRDQTPTEETVRLAQEYADKLASDKNTYLAYSKDVEDIQFKCFKKLYESDLNIYAFYMNKKSYNAAKVHLANMKKRFVPILNECEKELLTCELEVAKKLNDNELIAARQSELEHKYPNIQHESIKHDVLLAQNSGYQQTKHPVALF